MDVDLGQLSGPSSRGADQRPGLRGVYIESGAVEHLVDILENYQNPVLLCDSHTRAAAEPYLEEEFKDYPIIELDPAAAHADDRTMQKVLQQIGFCDRGCTAVCVDVLVAIGAGTIHDIAGCCAKEYCIDYISIPTAANNSALLSGRVKLTWEGKVKHVPAAVPVWILADTQILTRAPKELTKAGLLTVKKTYRALKDGDLEKKIGDDDFTDRSLRALRDVKRAKNDILAGDPEDMEKLEYALLLCGIIHSVIHGGNKSGGTDSAMKKILDNPVNS